MLDKSNKLIAIACGGTGGHLFPGISIANVLRELGYRILLIISQKDIDKQIVGEGKEFETFILPGEGLEKGGVLRFMAAFLKSYLISRKLWLNDLPAGFIGMGGFISVPPVLALPLFSVPVVIHEANAIPGRANRLLAPFVNRVCVFFEGAKRFLKNPRVIVTGMPVRSQFKQMDKENSRLALGLDPKRDVLLVVGGSQGAKGLNDIVVSSAHLILRQHPGLQILHITGKLGYESVRKAYLSMGYHAVVMPFLTEMEYALGAATVVVSRAGASSLAEFAAMGCVAVLIPFPGAKDNHQFYNAKAFADSGSAFLIEQDKVFPAGFAELVLNLLRNEEQRRRVSDSIKVWHYESAALDVAMAIEAEILGSLDSEINHMNLDQQLLKTWY
jgi:UDP-N-acetylglucosamine--N-acetylmuramyl-(pentapeptide) pyrophosphoryl-undecaprenol N-acetylglucosamine transferase